MRAGSPIFSYQNYMTLYTKLSDALQSYNYNLACKLLPFAAPGDSRLHSLGTIPRIRKSPHGDFRKGFFFMEPAKRLELLAC